MTEPTITEEWRPVEGWPYDVSCLGNVRRANSKNNLKPWRIPPIGYQVVSFYMCRGRGKRFYVHQLVCAAFNGKRPHGKPHTSHIDGDVNNNTPSNLRWATVKENCQDGKERISRGEAHSKGKLTQRAVSEIYLNATDTQKALAIMYGVSRSMIYFIKRKKVWKHVTDSL